jgi:hypothetical protein
VRARTLLFRVTCSIGKTDGHARVRYLLGFRSIIPNVCVASTFPGNRSAPIVLIKDAAGVQAIHLARIFERLPTVLRGELEVGGQAIDLHAAPHDVAHE